MDTRIFSAYNEASKRSLSAGLTVVDAAREPLMVLKVLMEGLPRRAPDGLWLINFKGVPVARSHSPFDLVYLDEHARVVQAIEISPTSVFEPFRGSPASAFILPPRTVAQSKTFTGDSIVVKQVGNLPEPAPPRVPAKSTIARPSARVVPAPAGRSFNVPSSQTQPVASGSLLRSTVVAPPAVPAEVAAAAVETPAPAVELAPQAASSPVMPPMPPESESAAMSTAVVEQQHSEAAEQTANALVPQTESAHEPQPIAAPESYAEAPSSAVEAQAEPSPDQPIVEAPLPPVDGIDAPAVEVHIPVQVEAELAPPPLNEPQEETYIVLVDPPPEDTDPEDTDIVPADVETLVAEPATAELAAMVQTEEDAPLVVAEESGPAATPITDLLIPSSATALGRPVPPILRNTWDVRLLYFFFPKLHPSYRPEFQAPRVGIYNQSKPRDEGKLTMKLRALCWLYPDLELDTVHLRQREARRAPRVSDPGLVGYFFTGGASKPNEIHNLSVTGFFMKTEERWLPGTVIRVTLQMMGSVGEDPGDTITVHSRVVNWNDEGGGFEFVLPGFID